MSNNDELIKLCMKYHEIFTFSKNEANGEYSSNPEEYRYKKILNEGIGYMYNYVGLSYDPHPDYCQIDETLLLDIAIKNNVKFYIYNKKLTYDELTSLKLEKSNYILISSNFEKVNFTIPFSI